MRAYERRRSYSGSGSLLAWLLTMCRNASVLRILEGRTTAQTAEALRIATGTVKATLHHALRNLASSFGDSDHDALL